MKLEKLVFPAIGMDGASLKLEKMVLPAIGIDGCFEITSPATLVLAPVSQRMRILESKTCCKAARALQSTSDDRILLPSPLKHV